MKTLPFLLLLTFFFSAVSSTTAQTTPPDGYTPGAVMLADGSRLEGYVKENIRSKASLCFVKDVNEKKKCYEGSDLNGAEVNGQAYRCIKGDFFKVISKGELEFLQKSSDASGKPVYNGNEAVFSNGTEGRPGDYFLYHPQTSALQHITRKNLTEVASASFSGCTEAIDKARAAGNDMAVLKEAVELYNHRNK